MDFFKKRSPARCSVKFVSSIPAYPDSFFYSETHDGYEKELMDSVVFVKRALSHCSIVGSCRRFLDHEFRLSSESATDISRYTNTLHTLNIDPLNPSIMFFYGPSGSGKTFKAIEAAKFARLEPIIIHPEDFQYNNQVFANTLSIITGSRRRDNFFERRKRKCSDNLLIVDELDVAADTNSTLFISRLAIFLSQIDIPVIITSNLPLSSFPEFINLKIQRVSFCEPSFQDCRDHYSAAFGRLLHQTDIVILAENEMNHILCNQESLKTKRKTNSRERRAIPSLWPEIQVDVRDILLKLFNDKAQEIVHQKEFRAV